MRLCDIIYWSVEYIAPPGAVLAPLGVEVLGCVLVQDLAAVPHRSPLGRLLHRGRHQLQRLAARRAHGEQLRHAGALQIVNLASEQRHVPLWRHVTRDPPRRRPRARSPRRRACRGDT